MLRNACFGAERCLCPSKELKGTAVDWLIAERPSKVRALKAPVRIKL